MFASTPGRGPRSHAIETDRVSVSGDGFNAQAPDVRSGVRGASYAIQRQLGLVFAPCGCDRRRPSFQPGGLG